MLAVGGQPEQLVRPWVQAYSPIRPSSGGKAIRRGILVLPQISFLDLGHWPRQRGMDGFLKLIRVHFVSFNGWGPLRRGHSQALRLKGSLLDKGLFSDK